MIVPKSPEWGHTSRAFRSAAAILTPQQR